MIIMVWSTENVDTLDVEFESAQLVKDKNTKHSGGMVEEDDSSDESSASSVVDSKQDHGSDEENDAPLDSFLATEINPHDCLQACTHSPDRYTGRKRFGLRP